MKINQLSRKFIVFSLLLMPNVFFGQVGINSTGVAPSADAMLDVNSTNKGVLIPRLSSAALITSPTLGLIFYNTTTNQFNYFNGTAWIAITNAASGTGWSLSGNNINNNNTGNVGIGTTTPKAAFNVAAGKTVLFGSDSSGLGSKLIWYPSRSAFRVGFVAISDSWDLTNVGPYSTAMGYNPTAWGSYATALGDQSWASGDYSTAMGSHTTASGDASLAMGYSTTASGNYSTALGYGTIASGQYSNALGYNTSASGLYSTALGYSTTASGNTSTAMGIYTHAKGIGSTAMGYSTYTTSDYSTVVGSFNYDIPNSIFVIGNGSNSNTKGNILTALKNGLIGIGTNSPIVPLHIAISNSVAETNTRYFSYATGSSVGILPNSTYNVGLLVDYDIVTKNSFVSAQTATTSDARIKNIIGLSNNQQDLGKIRQIQITDYHYKDAVNWGTQTFKKVIAQQVEEVFPQAVRKMASTIPDIYALADKVIFDKNNKTLTVSLSKYYDVKVGDKIEFVDEKQGKIQAEVEAVSGNSFTVKNWQFPTEKIFVFGREVKDFRVVDYEAISMLGISAIQQLAKENEALLNEIQKLKDASKKLNTRMDAIENLFSSSQTGK